MRGRLLSSVNFSLLFTNRREKRNVILQPLEASFDLYQKTLNLLKVGIRELFKKLKGKQKVVEI